MKPEEIDEDIDLLLENPSIILSKYHDAGTCWLLINRIIEQLREAKKTIRELNNEILELEFWDDL